MVKTPKQLKTHSRVMGVAETPFQWGQEETPLVGVVVRLPGQVEAIHRHRVSVDGLDATERVEELIRAAGWPTNLAAVMVKGASLAGFNPLDGAGLLKSTGVPLVTVSREAPDMKALKRALKDHLGDWEARFELIEARPPHHFSIEGVSIHGAAHGLRKAELERLLRLSTVQGGLPEPLRLARLVARVLI